MSVLGERIRFGSFPLAVAMLVSFDGRRIVPVYDDSSRERSLLTAPHRRYTDLLVVNDLALHPACMTPHKEKVKESEASTSDKGHVQVVCSCRSMCALLLTAPQGPSCRCRDAR